MYTRKLDLPEEGLEYLGYMLVKIVLQIVLDLSLNLTDYFL